MVGVPSARFRLISDNPEHESWPMYDIVVGGFSMGTSSYVLFIRKTRRLTRTGR